MTSNGDSVLNPSSVSVAALGDSQRRAHPRSPPLPRASSAKAAPSSSSRDKHPAARRVHNGDTSSEDGENESEAETIMLSPAKKAIKTERDDDGDNNNNNNKTNNNNATAIKEDVHARSPSTNGRKRLSLDDKTTTNGVKHGSEHDAKSPVPTSPSSRTASRHTKETSPVDSAKSPVQSTTSPSQPTTRGRSSSTVESRKRKLRDESNPKSLEPPRQKAKTEGLKDRIQPASPPTPGLGKPGRPHKRSQSTQSMVSGIAGRKRREITALALPAERWSDSSSENSSSPHNTQTSSLVPHTRMKRSSHRALESPARTNAHKRNVDKFGATRLARESEKGNISEVKAAYQAAPEELDQEDFAGITPLQKASLHGWTDVVEFLIDKGCRTDRKSNDQDTPLIDAVENGHINVVKLLLHKGKVNPHHQNKKGQRAIDVVDPDDEDADELEMELRAAMRRETKTSTTDDSIQPGSHPQKSASRLLYNEYNMETLIEKAGDGDILAVGELINSNIKPNIACGVAASRGGHYDILSILLASGLKCDPDPSKHSETPMLVAIGRGHLKIVTLLLEQDTFNPTRRNREGKTYYEISEDRRGPKWTEERDVLKAAYDNYRLNHKSPRRNKKEAPNPTGLRMKRKSSPKRERSSSPRHDTKRPHLSKPTAMSQVPQKSRRLMSGKEMANRGDKRRRRVVSDESSSEESEEEVRRPTKKPVSKPRSFSEGEEQKPGKKSVKANLEDHDVPKRSARAQSNDSDDDHRQKLPSKIRTKSEKVANAKPTPDTESPDERKPMRKMIRSRPMEEKIRRRRPSDDSIDDVKVKKTPTPSAKSTPAPPEKASTPESVRERREEVEKQAAEAKKKAVEAETRKREEEEAARKAAEEEETRKKTEAEAKAKREAEEAEVEAAHKREEAEAARKRAEEEAQRLVEEEERLQQELVARQGRIARLPRALRRACELGNDRPLHFSGEELGISAVFLPLFCVTSNDLRLNGKECSPKFYIMSFQAVGILGLPELDLARLNAPYCEWERNPVTRKQRELLLRQYDVALLAQDFCFPMEGTPDFDYAKIQESIKEARQQFLDMEGLYWIEASVLYPEVEKVESLRPLIEEIRDVGKRRQIHLADPEIETINQKTHKPRKSFMDVMLGQKNGLVNGIAGSININGGG